LGAFIGRQLLFLYELESLAHLPDFGDDASILFFRPFYGEKREEGVEKVLAYFHDYRMRCFAHLL
jgi:hypothetical protein